MDPDTLLRLLFGISQAQAGPGRAAEFDVPGPRMDLATQAAQPPVPVAPEAPSMFDSRTWVKNLFTDTPQPITPAAVQPRMVPTGLVPGAQPSGPMPALLTPGQAPTPNTAMPPRPVEPYMTEPMMGAPAPAAMPIPVPRPQNLGAVLEPNPTGYATNPWSKEGVLGRGPGPTAGANAAGLGSALKGVVSPAAPVAQKVSSPHAPAMGKLQGGNLAELLASLGIGPMQAFPGLKLPSTLGQALGGR